MAEPLGPPFAGRGLKFNWEMIPMTYFSKNDELKQGYNAYIDTSVDDMGTQMDVGLLVMEAGDVFTIEEAEKETAILLFAGNVTYEWDGDVCEAERTECLHN